jgi:ornithine decarboxylase
VITLSYLENLARLHGTPLFVVDHDRLRENYREFRRLLPRVQPYYAVKANCIPEVVETLYNEGASFDIASMAEFQLVNNLISNLTREQQEKYIWNKIIYANPIKAPDTLSKLNQFKPLMTYDNLAEVDKIKQYSPNAGLCLRIMVPNDGAVVELSSKFGADPNDAVNLILYALDVGLSVEGISFHVGSQTTKPDNYIRAIRLASDIFHIVGACGCKSMNLLDIGGGFPARYQANLDSFENFTRSINNELDSLFPKNIEIIAEPGRFLVASSCTLVAEVLGKSRRNNQQCYYINDGVYHTFSGVIFDHCQYHLNSFVIGPREVCTVFGPTCDALDVISINEELPELEIGDLVYSENIGAYSLGTGTSFNGFPPAKVVHVNYLDV